VICCPPCVSHEVFGFELMDVFECWRCQWTSEPQTSQLYTYRVYVADIYKLCSQADSDCWNIQQCLCRLWANEEQPVDQAQDDISPCENESSHLLKKQDSKSSIRSTNSSSTTKSLPLNKDKEMKDRNSENAIPTSRIFSRIVTTTTKRTPPTTPKGDNTTVDSPTKQSSTRFQRKIFKCMICSGLTAVAARYCLSDPKVFVCNLVWFSDKCSIDYIAVVTSLLTEKIDLNELFASQVKRKKSNELDRGYIFRGMVCYCGLHYVAFFFHWPSMTWILFDDFRIRHVAEWAEVVEMCVSSGFLPSLIFFEQSSIDSISLQQYHDFEYQFHSPRVKEMIDKARNPSPKLKRKGVLSKWLPA